MFVEAVVINLEAMLSMKPRSELRKLKLLQLYGEIWSQG
jgi:hypothetical protein